MDRVFDMAIADYYEGVLSEALSINKKCGQSDEMPLEVYLRGEENVNALESYALGLCSGRVFKHGSIWFNKIGTILKRLICLILKFLFNNNMLKYE